MLPGASSCVLRWPLRLVRFIISLSLYGYIGSILLPQVEDESKIVK